MLNFVEMREKRAMRMQRLRTLLKMEHLQCGRFYGFTALQMKLWETVVFVIENSIISRLRKKCLRYKQRTKGYQINEKMLTEKRGTKANSFSLMSSSVRHWVDA
ncbi:CLUMA_CG005822, isoform A [Clunio marinus]|uniref:CLUMA_CG005822, isoform A n=1 Tax=Clunio marinus TaxID=568069 RepID=A0A1J1HW78_9DIPT|nr:CLUMA_CG005822, isoform A [Clunio marinus]